MPNTEEVWKAVPGFDLYDVSNYGGFRSWRGGGYSGPNIREKPLSVKRKPTPAGYMTASMIGEDGKPHNYFIHCLVLLTFVGPRPEEMVCRHLDGNPANNHLTNLKWGTQTENAADKVLHERDNTGSRHWSTSLTEADVLFISYLYILGFTYVDLAELFGVANKSVIQKLVKRITWKHVPVVAADDEGIQDQPMYQKAVKLRHCIYRGLNALVGNPRKPPMVTDPTDIASLHPSFEGTPYYQLQKISPFTRSTTSKAYYPRGVLARKRPAPKVRPPYRKKRLWQDQDQCPSRYEKRMAHTTETNTAQRPPHGWVS